MHVSTLCGTQFATGPGAGAGAGVVAAGDKVVVAAGAGVVVAAGAGAAVLEANVVEAWGNWHCGLGHLAES